MQSLMKPREVATILSVNYHTVLDLIHAGELEAHVINKRYRISQAQLHDFLEKTRYRGGGA
ncbi:helix-turn-helix domain-containing protein [Candidatus Neomarinimicrobiota bacterium]